MCKTDGVLLLKRLKYKRVARKEAGRYNQNKEVAGVVTPDDSESGEQDESFRW